MEAVAYIQQNPFLLEGKLCYNDGMSVSSIISILCPDRVGLVADVTGHLFDLGANLEDTTFAVLGGIAEFTIICDINDDISLASVEAGLRGLPGMADAELSVSPFKQANANSPSGHMTHRITIVGGDRPGLIARLCEVFVQFRVNIVRMNSEKKHGPNGDGYEVRFGVWIPRENIKTCLSTVANTAGELGLDYRSSEICHDYAASKGNTK